MLEDIVDYPEDSIWNNNYVAAGVALSPVMRYSNIGVHEILGHGLAAKLFGGDIEEIGIAGNPLWPSGGYATLYGNFTPIEHAIISAAGPIASYALGAGLIIYGIKKKNKTAVASGTVITAGSTAYHLYSLSTLYTGVAWGDMASIALLGGISAGALAVTTLAVSIPILALGIYGLSKRVRDSLGNLKSRIRNRF